MPLFCTLLSKKFSIEFFVTLCLPILFLSLGCQTWFWGALTAEAIRTFGTVCEWCSSGSVETRVRPEKVFYLSYRPTQNQRRTAAQTSYFYIRQQGSSDVKRPNWRTAIRKCAVAMNKMPPGPDEPTQTFFLFVMVKLYVVRKYLQQYLFIWRLLRQSLKMFSSSVLASAASDRVLS